MKLPKILCKLNLHDWRYASHAPNSKAGDVCGICENCQQRRVMAGFDAFWSTKIVKSIHQVFDYLEKLQRGY